MKYKNLNLKYAVINAAFMFLVCATSGYAYNFLSQSGFSDGTVGIIITAISICGLIGQPLAGSIIDKSDKIDEKKFISGAMILTAALAVLLGILPNGSFAMMIVTIACFFCAAVSLPFFNSMAFIYEKDGQTINYGLGRGVGSGAYAIGSSLLGQLWGWLGKNVLPWYICLFAVLCFFLVQLMPTPSAEAEKAAEQTEEAHAANLSYAAFFKKYGKIVPVVCALILMYFCHMLVNTYMAKIVAHILERSGSTAAVESVQGNALFIAAMAELPTMFLFSKLLEKTSVNKLMLIASVFYTLKHFLMWICPNVPMFYAVMLLQMLSYAVLTPAGVYFANENVAPEDRNKGQAVLGITLTVGGLLASFVGGQLFQFMSVSNVVLVGVIASAAGTALMICGINRLGTKKA